LVNKNSGKCVDVTNFGTANGSPVQQYDCWGNSAQSFSMVNLGTGSATGSGGGGTTTGPASAGKIYFNFRTSGGSDSMTDSPTQAAIDWMNNMFHDMCVFVPYFNSRTSWFKKGLVYEDHSGMYTWDGIDWPGQHPDYLMYQDNGKPAYINWGCNGSDYCPQYEANVNNAGFQNYWISRARDHMNQGSYMGLWIDDVNLRTDAIKGDGGQSVTIVDPNRNRQVLQDNDWKRYFANFMVAVRNAFPSKTILHNALWFNDGPSGTPTNPDVIREIDAADILNVESGLNDGNLSNSGDWSLDAMLKYGEFILSRPANGTTGVPKKVVYEANGTDPAGWMDSISKYYLISNGNVMLGDDSNYFVSHQLGTHWSGLNTDLGAPTSNRKTLSNGLYRRDFQKGITLVNPPKAAPVTYTLPQKMNIVGGGGSVTSVTLQGGHGIVLTY
jgi:hypothetical protein